MKQVTGLMFEEVGQAKYVYLLVAKEILEEFLQKIKRLEYIDVTFFTNPIISYHSKCYDKILFGGHSQRTLNTLNTLLSDLSANKDLGWEISIVNLENS